MKTENYNFKKIKEIHPEQMSDLILKCQKNLDCDICKKRVWFNIKNHLAKEHGVVEKNGYGGKQTQTIAAGFLALICLIFLGLGLFFLFLLWGSFF